MKLISNSMDVEDTSAVATIGPYRDALPTHFSFQIQSFSMLAATSMEKFKSNDFEAGGYEWRLVFYPKGNKTTTTNTSTGENHVSMYLKIVGTDSLPRGWVVNASFRFFVLDQIRDKYLILGDMGGKTRKFHEMKKMWGYDQLLPLTTLNDSFNGYLVDDTCVFGAEVLPCKNTGCGDRLTMVKSPSCVKYTWKIENFSSITEESIYSDVFYVEDYKWKIEVYPKGESRENNEYFSVFLCLDKDDSINNKVYARCNYRVRDQLHNIHMEKDGDERWFTSSLDVSWGYSDYMRLDELNDESKGYLVNDTIIVEAEVTVLGALKKLS